MLNYACNLVVFATAWRAHGQVGLKLGRALSAVLGVHGTLAFAILASRLFFSRSLLLLALAVSVVLALVTVSVRHREKGLRVAVVSPDQTVEPGIASLGEVVASPERDMRPFDVILMPMQETLSAAWTAGLARAMLAGAQVRHMADYLEEARGQTSIAHFHLDQLSDRTLASYLFTKRVIDVGLVLFFLPVTLPLAGFALLAVRLTMGGPALFVQERMGLGGRPFRMYKIRTMRPAIAGVTQTTGVRDVRVTRLGLVLRKTRIDELPQMWNVLKGDMSLIGPRPEWTPLHEDYCRDLPAYAYRLMVRPGITGWAQIRSGYAGDLAETRVKLSFDLYYVKNLSLALDMQIALRTIWTLVSGSGAR